MGPGTDIKTPPKIPLWSGADLNKLLDLYWGGSERRITGLTLRILGVNVLALLILVFGLIYLGQYHNQLIQARLETFQREVELVSVIFSEGELLDAPDQEEFARIIHSLSLENDKELYLFNDAGKLVIRTQAPENGVRRQSAYQSFIVLKNLVNFVSSWIPGKRELPYYPQIRSLSAADYPLVSRSLEGVSSLAAWQTRGSRVFLTSSEPLVQDGAVQGALYMTWQGYDIEDDIFGVSLTLLSIFTLTLICTILLSIYLSGTIARPLKKLTRAAENVRKGKGDSSSIPDLSARNDEIGELSLVLRSMTAGLYERMDSIERFAADVSHELKNPLTSLSSAVETLSVVKKRADKEKLMGIIVHDISRLDRLITDISRLSRLDSQLSRKAFEKIDIENLFNALLKTYRNPLERVNDNSTGFKHHEITFHTYGIKNAGLHAWGLEAHLMQVFENILSNAVSFTPAGGDIRIKVESDKRRIIVMIENDGSVIPEGKEEAIFERFYTQRPGHEAYGQNSGLGLSICRQIIKAHGGRIYAQNLSGGQGVRFSVVLNKA